MGPPGYAAVRGAPPQQQAPPAQAAPEPQQVHASNFELVINPSLDFHFPRLLSRPIVERCLFENA